MGKEGKGMAMTLTCKEFCLASLRGTNHQA